jgi:hypothetical protein
LFVAWTVQILSVGVGKMERVDYMLEFAQWMGSNGVPSADISVLVSKALDALSEVEAQTLPKDANASDSGEGSGEGAEGADMLSAAGSNARSKGTLSRAGTGLRGAASTSGQSRAGTQKGGLRSTAGSVSGASEPKLGPDGKPIEEEKLPPRLDFKMLEQCARVLTMQSMLEGNQARQTAKCLTAADYLHKSVELWMATLYVYYRTQAYAALKPEQRGECPFPPPEVPKGMNKQQAADYAAMLAAAPPPVTYPTLESYSPPRPDFLSPPEEPILLVAWLSVPAPQLVEVMLLGNAQNAADVPSKTSLPTVQLSVHYWLTLADTLRCNGHSKAALFVYCYVRLILLYLKPGVSGTSAVLSVVHFQCFTLLMEMGLPTEAHALNTVLPTDAAGDAKVAASATPLNIGAYLSKVSVLLLSSISGTFVRARVPFRTTHMSAVSISVR